MFDGNDVKRLFLKSSHLRLRNLGSNSSGSTTSRLPSRYKPYVVINIVQNIYLQPDATLIPANFATLESILAASQYSSYSNPAIGCEMLQKLLKYLVKLRLCRRLPCCLSSAHRVSMGKEQAPQNIIILRIMHAYIEVSNSMI